MQKLILKFPRACENKKWKTLKVTYAQKHYFAIKNKKFQISKAVMSNSIQIWNMFHNQELDYLNGSDEKALIINLDVYKIPIKALIAFLRIFQKQQITIYKNEQMVQILKLSQIFKIQWIIDCVAEDIVLNTDQYDCFILLQLSELLSIGYLKKKCFQQLQSLDYEQLNFNCYDLLNCDEKTFKNVLKSHHHFQLKHARKKQSDSTIIRIVQEYCKLNNTTINPVEYISQNLFSIVEQKQGEEVEDQQFKKMQNFAHEEQKMSEQTNAESEKCEFEQYLMRTSSHKNGRIVTLSTDLFW